MRLYLCHGVLLAGWVLFASGCSLQQAPSPTSTAVKEHVETALPEMLVLSAKALKLFEIKAVALTPETVLQELEVPAQLNTDQEAVFKVGSIVSGRLEHVTLRVGDTVKEGQVLAQVRNTETPKVQASYRHEHHQNSMAIQQAQVRLNLTQKTLEREKKLYAQDISPRKDLEQAQNDYEQARLALEAAKEHQVHIQSEADGVLTAYGVNSNLNEASERISGTTPIHAPRSGVIIEKHATSGSVVQPIDDLFIIGDFSKLWLDITLYPDQLQQVKMGMPVVFYSDALPDHPLRGTIDYLPPIANETSRTYIARIFLQNPEGLYRPGSRGKAFIQVKTFPNALSVPIEAIHQVEGKAIVFKMIKAGKYKVTPIKVGYQDSQHAVITQGLAAGDHVVTQGSFTLKSELLKNQFEGHGD